MNKLRDKAMRYGKFRRIHGMTVSCLLVCFMLFPSCKEDEGCRTERYVRMYAGFYTIQTNAATNVQTAVKLFVDTLSIQGIGAEAYAYNKAARKDSVRLALNNQADLSEFIFTFQDTLRRQILSDTLSVYYQRVESYLSFECGTLNTFTIDSIQTRTTHHFIDSIIINSKEVNTTTDENIKIYHTPL